MARRRNIVAAALAVIAGALLLLSGTHGPIGTYEFILQNLPMLTNNGLILSVAKTAALVLITISLLGGFVLFAAAYMLFKDHSRAGKLAIGLGTGAGVPWILLVLVTLVTTANTSAVLAQYNTLGWIGIILALAARFVAK
jgi:hypothetical protein